MRLWREWGGVRKGGKGGRMVEGKEEEEEDAEEGVDPLSDQMEP